MPTENETGDAMLRESRALQTLARRFTAESGPASTAHQREHFAHDLEAGALRYARAYYAHAKTLGLIPENAIAQNAIAAQIDRISAAATDLHDHLQSADPVDPEHALAIVREALRQTCVAFRTLVERS